MVKAPVFPVVPDLAAGVVGEAGAPLRAAPELGGGAGGGPQPQLAAAPRARQRVGGVGGQLGRVAAAALRPVTQPLPRPLPRPLARPVLPRHRVQAQRAHCGSVNPDNYIMGYFNGLVNNEL